MSPQPNKRLDSTKMISLRTSSKSRCPSSFCSILPKGHRSSLILVIRTNGTDHRRRRKTGQGEPYFPKHTLAAIYSPRIDGPLLSCARTWEILDAKITRERTRVRIYRESPSSSFFSCFPLERAQPRHQVRAVYGRSSARRSLSPIGLR